MSLTFKNSMLLFLACCSTACLSQTTEVPSPKSDAPKPEKKIEAGFEGMIGLSFNHKTIGINVGGPSLKYRFTTKFKIGAGAFPSLIILDKKAYPRFAVSPIIEYRNWMFITPYYGYDTEDNMIWTYGIGYRF